jgi:glycosyltransferase
MKNNIILSIVTVVYNGENTIEKTINSVNNQTYKNIEYIIVDGYSKDKTWDIILNNKSKITKYLQVHDSGIYDAMNIALKYCSGEYIYYLNSSDILYDNKVISDIVDFCIENKLPDMVYGGIIHKNPITGIDSIRTKNREFSLNDISRGKTINHQAIFIKREVMNKIGAFDISYRLSADYDIECKIFISPNYNIQYIDRLIIEFYGGGASSNLWAVYKEKRNIIKHHFGWYNAIMYSTTRGFTLIVINLLHFFNILNPLLKITRYSENKNPIKQC